MEVAIL
jgi:predicted amidohydrolase